MFSFNGKKNKQNKKKSKKAQKDEEYQTAFTKIDGFYQELHSINTELKEMAEHVLKNCSNGFLEAMDAILWDSSQKTI